MIFSLKIYSSGHRVSNGTFFKKKTEFHAKHLGRWNSKAFLTKLQERLFFIKGELVEGQL
jgi:hypothetical protein